MVKASELVKQQLEKDKLKDEIYKKIYNRIEHKITIASAANLYECWYDVPEFIFNIPLYKLEDCIIYLIKKLKKNEFKVKRNNNIIYISWKI
jgi:hypothetical protein